MRRLTDTTALTRNRLRALRQGPALFLHDALRADVDERLAMVNRTFTDPAIVTGWPQVWQGWRAARFVPDTPLLDLRAGAHDLIIHALSLHWADDPVGQLVQCRRALRPDGLMIAVLFGGQTLNELRAALAQAESNICGGLSPRVLPMGEIRDLGGLMGRAGFALPVADQQTLRVRYQTPIDLMRDLRSMGESNALDARPRRPMRRDVLNEAERLYSASQTLPDGRIPATFELVTLTGWAPDDSQPQPLTPGSASHRLADILAEIKDDSPG